MKKLILILIVAFAGVAYADDPAQKQQEQACYDLLNKDPAFADSIPFLLLCVRVYALATVSIVPRAFSVGSAGSKVTSPQLTLLTKVRMLMRTGKGQ